MAISFSYMIEGFELKNESNTKRWIGSVIESNGKREGTIAYLFCDDKYILEANQRFLDHDTYTDIITFDYVAADLISGDIMISVERVEDNAKKFGVSMEEELNRVIIHGILHLLGQGDKSEADAKQMRVRENEALIMLSSRM